MHRRFSSDDAGFTLVEVIVAMAVFAVIATGFLYVMTAGLVQTRDTRARVVAANLAAEEIDIVRSIDSVVNVDNRTRTVTLNGDTFRIDRSWGWATSTGGTATCEAGAATGALTYKRVTVEVTWDNKPPGARPVVSNTSYNPRSKLNDPERGTILVGVVDSAGAGVSGATVTLNPANGVAPATTDSDGCAYLLKVPPGDSYTVSASKADHISDQQVATPTAVVSVARGTTSRASFALDRATSYTLTYAGNVTDAKTLPNNLATTFISTYGNFPSVATSNANPRTITRYPVASGYSIVAGAFVDTPGVPATSCLAPDPGQWGSTLLLAGARPDPVAGLPGGSAPATSVPMGVVQLTAANGGIGTYLKAVYVGGANANALTGDPGCGAGMTYTFGNIVVSNSATIALPYGTWQLYRGTSTAQTTPVTLGVAPVTSGSATLGVIVLDPRTAVTP